MQLDYQSHHQMPLILQHAAVAIHACCKLSLAIAINPNNLHLLSWGLIKGVNKQQM